jgi:Na+-driven multidrug efflux pump
MLAFLQTAIGTSTQRYMSHSIGMGDKKRLQSIFRISNRLGLLLGLFLVVAIEAAGFFFFSSLNIAPDRVFATRIVFHFVVLTTFFAMISLPLNSAIIAHEDIFVISIVFILESILKLAVAIYLIHSPFDKLIVYGVLIAAVYIGSFFIKWLYCRIKYEECKGKEGKIDRSLLAEITRFSGWNTFDPLTTTFSTQGIAVILNLFTGTIVNAAYGIANQVNGQLYFFSASLLMSMNPQIMKSEGSKERARTLRLSMLACKLSFFLLAFFSIPILIKMPYILQLWLKDVPEYTVLFCRMMLVSTLLSQTSYALQSAIIAIGKIKKYQIAIGISKLLVLPLSFCLLKMGAPIYMAVSTFIIVEIINMMIRLQIAGKLMRFKFRYFLNRIIFRLLLSLLIAGTISMSVLALIPESFLQLTLIVIVSSISLLLLLKLLILDENESKQVENMFMKYIGKYLVISTYKSMS